MHERDVGARPAERHPQCIEHERRAHVARQLPADDLAAIGVGDEGEEDEPLPAAQVGEVGDPEPVGRSGVEVALDEVRPALGL